MANALVLLLAHPIMPIVHMIVRQLGGLTAVISTMAGLLGIDSSEWAHSSGMVDGDGLIARRLQQYDTESAWAAQESGTAEIQWGVVVGQWAGNVIVTVIIWVCVAYFYKSQVTDRRDPFPQAVSPDYSLANNDWKYSTFSCFDDITYCLYGCCCGGMRIADTYAATAIGGFWKFMSAWLAMYVFAQVLNLGLLILISVAELDANVGQAGNLLYFIAELFLAYWLATQRQELRRKLGDTKQGTMCMDFICYWWCGCCTAIQDARQVDGASGTSVQCCCKLIKEQAAAPNVVMGMVVGEPVGSTK